MRPALELNLDQGGRGKVNLGGFELPFATAVKLEASVTERTKAAIEFLPAATVVRAHGIDLPRETIEGLEEICREWRRVEDGDERTDTAAMRAFDRWYSQPVPADVALGWLPRETWCARLRERFAEIYAEEAGL